jgi:hypothetical protein
MEDWSIPLIVATAAFLAFLLWRMRPAFSSRLADHPRQAAREALREAKARIESATDEPARALALCDAADILVKKVGRGASAKGLYLRAMRADPRSTAIVSRAVVGLARRPRTLEAVLWRHLAAAPWRGDMRDATRTSLDALRTLYEGRRKNAVRARALANAMAALE